MTRIEHNITPDKWMMTVGFAEDGNVASPQVTPSPPTTGIEDGVWQTPTLTGTWVNYGGSYKTAGYMRKNGVVYLTGLVDSGTANTAIFTLPAGFRPSATLILAGVGQDKETANSSAANSGASSQANTGSASGHQHPMPHQHTISHTHSTTNVGVRIDVGADGVVKSTGASTGWISLAGISFPAEA